MSDYPSIITPVNHVESVPRRIRAFLGGEVVLDTTRARYVWESVHYPAFYIPLEDVRADVLIDEGNELSTRRGTVRMHGLRVNDAHRQSAARVVVSSGLPGVTGTVRFDWAALDAWFEESEQVFIHPRDPYTRVDALRSTRSVRVSLEGVVLAESASPVMVFETGLPTRYYLERPDVDFSRLVASPTETGCPYKGVTSGYWSAPIAGTVHADLAWSYQFPTAPLLPIAGLIAFYNERVDISIDGVEVERPKTVFS
jgi:uncharacterized protein (DUF427 family)